MSDQLQRIVSAEDEAFVAAVSDLVQDIMLLRNGESTEEAVRDRLDEVLRQLHSLPVRGWLAPSGMRLAVYTSQEEDLEFDPDDDDRPSA
jgi:hypothetical protein